MNAIARPPMEFRGRARAWLTKLDADDAGFASMAERIGMSLRKPLAQGKVVKPADFAEAARRWRDELPTSGRLKLEIDLSQRSLVIRELRAEITEQFIIKDWSAKEHAVAVFIHFVAAKRRAAFEYQRQLVATVSLHALTRRMQRAFDCSDEAIRDDLIAQAAHSAQNDLTGRFVIPVPDGAWAGRLQYSMMAHAPGACGRSSPTTRSNDLATNCRFRRASRPISTNPQIESWQVTHEASAAICSARYRHLLGWRNLAYRCEGALSEDTDR